MADEPSRDRSASPAREPKAKKHKSTGGFKWKEKRPHETAHHGDDRSNATDGRLERGYRDRSPRRDNYRDRRDRDGDHDRRDHPRSAEARTQHGDSYRGERSRDRPDDDHRARDRDSARRADGDPYRHPDRVGVSEQTNDESRYNGDVTEAKETKEKKKEKKDKDKKRAAVRSAPASTEPMIVVNVNDRLGTKAAIPCLASDSVKAFKAMVAAHIGRQPHEIMLKRQGERPFKDQLTLADYGVSHGVQLDLELDTGD